MNRPAEIAIIGSGIGGLGCASLLAAAGHKVCVIEKNSWLGGKCRRIVHDQVTFDTGPAIFSFPSLWRSFVDRCQTLSHRDFPAVRLHRLHQVGRYLNESFDHQLPAESSTEIYQDWLRYRGQFKGFGKCLEQLLQIDPKSAGAIRPALTMFRYLDGHFALDTWLKSFNCKSPAMSDILSIQALNCGASPDFAPALFAAMPAFLDEDGVYSVQGGIYTLVLAMEAWLREHGAEIYLNSAVESIQDKTVTLANGKRRSFDLIVSNLDPQLTCKLSHTHQKFNEIAKLSCSVVGLFGAVDQRLTADWPYHQVIIPEDTQVFFGEMKTAKLPTSTMCFIHYYPRGDHGNPDPDHATATILLTIPAADYGAEDLERFKAQCLGRIAQLLRIPAEPNKASGPLASLWKSQPRELSIRDYAAFGHPSGALYGTLHGAKRSGPFHPVPYHNKKSDVWQVGAGVHPGGGIPGSLGGAIIAADQIQKFLSKKTRSRQAVSSTNSSEFR